MEIPHVLSIIPLMLDATSGNVIKLTLISRQGDRMSEKSIQVPRPDCLRNLLKWNNFPLIGRRSVYEKCSSGPILFSSVNQRRNSFWLPHNQCSG